MDGSVDPAPDTPQAAPLGDDGAASAAPAPADAEAVDRLIERLESVCGAGHVVRHPHALRTYESDGLLQYRVLPRAAVLPGSAEEVAAVVRACHEAEVPWVARGSGSGLSGGALPVEDGILIVLTRMRRILEVDLDNGRVTCEPGVTNIAISQAVAPDFFYPPDPSSQIVCSIGGNVAENSGGAHCFKYGFTTNYVTGLEVVLPDGEVVQLGGKEVDPLGYDLLGAFVGSEGTLGVATKITLRVVPSPESTRTLVAFFESTARAGRAVSDIVAAGVVPGAIEMMDQLSIRASEKMGKAGWPTDVGAALLVELDGPESECEARFEEVREICDAAGSSEVRVARDPAERDLFWKMRKSAFPAMGRISPHYYVQDSVIPRTRLVEVLERIEELAQEAGLTVANVFHAGDGNLHPLVCYDGNAEGEAERAEELAGAIVVACVDAGGSITGEHGVGVDKKRYMPKMFEEPDLEAFQRLRCAFDPGGMANPGKVMPTPRLCGEVPGPYRQHPLEQAGVAERFVVTARAIGPAEALRVAAADGLRVRFVGAGTKIGWGAPVEADVEISTADLDEIVEHNAGDLTAVLGAGVPVATAQETFARAGQMLALDPPDDGATIGGLLATGDSGPLRHRYGGPRDLVLGVKVALSDGTVARAGGKVIKNVAGYDLAKLFTGAFGTLGLILEVALRLHPRPAVTATAVIRREDPVALCEAAAALARRPLEHECLDLRWEDGAGLVLARFAGPTAADRAADAGEEVVEDDDELWNAQRRAQRGDLVVRVSSTPTALPAVLAAAPLCVARAALGLAWVAVPEPAAVEELRARLAPAPCVVLDAPQAARASLDPWGPVDAGRLALMRRLKARFDPQGACNPGIFVGGI